MTHMCTWWHGEKVCIQSPRAVIFLEVAKLPTHEHDYQAAAEIAYMKWYAGSFCISCTICPYYWALYCGFDTQGLRTSMIHNP